MSLYYNINTYELRELDDSLVSAWESNANPKRNEWIAAPIKPDDTAIWDNGVWVIEQQPIPTNVSARQIRLWLIQNGYQLFQIDNAINSIEDPIIRETVKIEWEYAPYVDRSHPWLLPLAQSLGLSSEQIDQAFIEASQI